MNSIENQTDSNKVFDLKFVSIPHYAIQNLVSTYIHTYYGQILLYYY